MNVNKNIFSQLLITFKLQRLTHYGHFSPDLNHSLGRTHVPSDTHKFFSTSTNKQSPVYSMTIYTVIHQRIGRFNHSVLQVLIIKIITRILRILYTLDSLLLNACEK